MIFLRMQTFKSICPIGAMATNHTPFSSADAVILANTFTSHPITSSIWILSTANYNLDRQVNSRFLESSIEF